MFAIYIFTFMYNSLVENGIKKKKMSTAQVNIS